MKKCPKSKSKLNVKKSEHSNTLTFACGTRYLRGDSRLVDTSQKCLENRIDKTGDEMMNECSGIHCIALGSGAVATKDYEVVIAWRGFTFFRCRGKKVQRLCYRILCIFNPFLLTLPTTEKLK